MPRWLSRRAISWLSLLVLLVPPLPAQAAVPFAKGGSAFDLIAAVNGLRAVNGLPAYKVNGTLMAVAQAHSEYQAAISSVTHTGSGLSLPAAAASRRYDPILAIIGALIVTGLG